MVTKSAKETLRVKLRPGRVQWYDNRMYTSPDEIIELRPFTLDGRDYPASHLFNPEKMVKVRGARKKRDES